jgi:adenine-specific DNA methylase
MANQKEIMSNFVKQHQQDLQALKIQHEASVQAVQEECQELWEVQIKQVEDKHKQEIGALQEEISRLIQEKNVSHIQMMSVATLSVSADQTDRATKLDSATIREMAALQTIQQLQDEIKDKVQVSNLN